MEKTQPQIITNSTKSPRPKKSLGQHFLTDRHIRNRIMTAADLTEKTQVVEIGAGKGFLTKELVRRSGNVVVVELDNTLAQRLAGQLGQHPSLKIITGDARTISIGSLAQADRPYKLVANLPYYAATPIIRRFLEAEHKPATMIVMVQREVAKTMTALPGKMSLLSIATQIYGKPRIICNVPARAFKPPPSVVSSVVKIDIYSKLVIPEGTTQEFFNIVRAGFSAPRKQLINSLSIGLSIPPSHTKTILVTADIEPSRRAQTLTINEWIRIAEKYHHNPQRGIRV